MEAQAQYYEGLALAAPLGGRGGLGLSRKGSAAAERKRTKAERELLPPQRGRGGAKGPAQTTVARAIVYGNEEFDPWKKPVREEELHAVNTSRAGLYANFQSAGLLEGSAPRPLAAAATSEGLRRSLRKNIRARLKEAQHKGVNIGKLRKALRPNGTVPDYAKTFRRVLKRGALRGKWHVDWERGLVSQR